MVKLVQALIGAAVFVGLGTLLTYGLTYVLSGAEYASWGLSAWVSVGVLGLLAALWIGDKAFPYQDIETKTED